MTMVFINLPTEDLARAKAFHEALGHTIDPRFTDETAACVVISDTIFAMLLTHAKFREFTSETIAPRGTKEVLVSLTVDDPGAVDATIEAAVAAGGAEAGEAKDLGFMRQRAFSDPDGHHWEVVWMDPSAVQ